MSRLQTMNETWLLCNCLVRCRDASLGDRHREVAVVEVKTGTRLVAILIPGDNSGGLMGGQ